MANHGPAQAKEKCVLNSLVPMGRRAIGRDPVGHTERLPNSGRHLIGVRGVTETVGASRIDRSAFLARASTGARRSSVQNARQSVTLLALTMERIVHHQDQTLFDYILSLSDADVVRLDACLSRALFAEHDRQRRIRPANPPSDACFAQQVGLRPNTYSKARRSADRGLAHRWSRTSLAAIVRSEHMPTALVRAAYILLWRATPIARQASCIGRALASRALLGELANPAIGSSLQRVDPARGDTGGVDAA